MEVTQAWSRSKLMVMNFVGVFIIAMIVVLILILLVTNPKPNIAAYRPGQALE